MDGIDTRAQLQEFIQGVVDKHPALAGLRSLQSTALLLAVAAQRKTAFGFSTVTWPGGNRLTSVTTITHGLPGIAQTILLASGTTNMSVSWQNNVAASFDVVGNTIDGTAPALGTVRGFAWLAIG